MTTELPDDESLTQFSPRGEIDAVFGYGHPNPERVGCPPAEPLDLLAHRQLPIGHVGYEHLADCSPCYRRVRVLKVKGRASRARARLRFSSASASPHGWFCDAYSTERRWGIGTPTGINRAMTTVAELFSAAASRPLRAHAGGHS
jgi:hypothetical protein